MARPDVIQSTIETLDRLGGLLDLVEQGSTTSKDDLAVVLHLLIGQGQGYGLISKLCVHLGSSEPELAVWNDPMPESTNTHGAGPGMSLVLGVRAYPSGPITSTAPISTAVTDTVIRWRHPALPPSADWSFQSLVKKVRNNFGGHLDDGPPKWLAELRYYAAGDSDPMTYLFWSYGQAIHEALTNHLSAHGITTSPRPKTRYLNGVDFDIGLVFGDAAGNIDVRAQIACSSWISGRRRRRFSAVSPVSARSCWA